jgi:uncharacterized membrane protein
MYILNLLKKPRPKELLYIACFFSSLLSGYSLGLLNSHKSFLQKFDLLKSNFNFLWLKQFANLFQLTPNINFLSDVIAFEAAVVAIAIPLSFEIISRISERYQSQVITKKFNQEWEIKALPFIFIINIIIAVGLKFFLSDHPTSNFWKFAAWLVLILFLVASIIFCLFIPKLRRYITNTEFLLNNIFVDAEKLFKVNQQVNLNNKELVLRQAEFVRALEGIGDILTFETKNKKGSKDVIQGLKRIEDIVKRFLDIQKHNPKKFERLLLSQDFFKIYQENQQDAELVLALAPDKYLISFSTAINQLLRIHEAAIATKNDEISKFATYYLTSLLAHTSQTPNNNLLVEQLLKNISDIRRFAIINQDISMYTTTTGWYIHIVFNTLNKEGFDLCYLELFDRYFFESVKYIILENKAQIFQYLITLLVNGIHRPFHNEGSIDDYAYLLWESNFQKYNQLYQDYKIDVKVKDLEYFGSYIDTRKKLDLWLGKFDEIKRILEPQFNPEQKINAKRMEVEIRDIATFQFKYNNLIIVVFAIGAYCLFKKQPEYIKELWEYKQPPDSDAMWIGNDIIPNTIDNLINLYFGEGFFRNSFIYWEEHHGKETYYKKYFLLLLARMLQKGEQDQIINSYNLPNHLNTYCLNDINYSVGNLVEIVGELKKETDVLRTLGFDITKVDEIFDNKLIAFLQSLKPKVERQIKSIARNQKISSNKVDEFKANLTDGFNEMIVIRNIFKNHNIYDDKTNEELKNTLDSFGFAEVRDKDAFFEEWYIDYTKIGTTYGRNIARSEDLQLIKEIASYCTEIKVDNLEEVFKKFNNLSNLLIISKNISMHDFFSNSKNFKLRWETNVPAIETRGFVGWYKINEENIPAFERYFQNDNEKIVMFIDTSKLGKFIQYSPLNEGNKEEFVKDIFHMNIQAFSENIELMNNVLNNPPDWLVDVGDKDKQREHLEEKVLIEVSEKFELSKSQEFEGYLVKLSN